MGSYFLIHHMVSLHITPYVWSQTSVGPCSKTKASKVLAIADNCDSQCAMYNGGILCLESWGWTRVVLMCVRGGEGLFFVFHCWWLSLYLFLWVIWPNANYLRVLQRCFYCVLWLDVCSDHGSSTCHSVDTQYIACCVLHLKGNGPTPHHHLLQWQHFPCFSSLTLYCHSKGLCTMGALKKLIPV